MRTGSAITQEETIRNRADNYRDRKCRETEHERQGLQNKTQKLLIMTASICINGEIKEESVKVRYSLDHLPCSLHKRLDAPRGAGLLSVSRLRKDRYHFVHPP